MEHRPEVMALLCRASTLASNWQPYDSQKLPLAMLMQGHRVALQCLTGEGAVLDFPWFSGGKDLQPQLTIIYMSSSSVYRCEPVYISSYLVHEVGYSGPSSCWADASRFVEFVVTPCNLVQSSRQATAACPFFRLQSSALQGRLLDSFNQ